MRWVVLLAMVSLGCEALLPDREYPRVGAVAAAPRDERVLQCVVDRVLRPCARAPRGPFEKRSYGKLQPEWPPSGWLEGMRAPVVNQDDPILYRRIPLR